MTNLISKAFGGHNIRIITDQQGEPWFVAADIAKVLEYTEASAMTRHLDDDEKGLSIVQTLDVHHRTYKNRGNEKFADLIVLCRACHSKHHGKGDFR